MSSTDVTRDGWSEPGDADVAAPEPEPGPPEVQWRPEDDGSDDRLHVLLATADAEFECRVRSSLSDLGNPDVPDEQPAVASSTRVARVLRSVHDIGDDVDVVVLGPDVPVAAALELAHEIDALRPEVAAVIFAKPSKHTLRSALHAAVRDVVAPDAEADEIAESVARACHAARARRAQLRAAIPGPREGESPAPEPEHARVLTVLCPKGGAGKTTVATNLTVGLAHAAPGEVVIVDLDVQFGDVASSLGMRPEHTLTDVIAAGDHLGRAELKAYLTPHPRNLFALCAPTIPTDADRIAVEGVQRVLKLLTDSFKYVVIDTAAGLDEMALAALEFSTDFIILSATDVPSVRNTRKEVDALEILGRPEQRWHFVLNRADARTGLSIEAIEQAVGLSVDVAIPSSIAVPTALNEAVPLLESDPRSPVSLAMAQLVRRVAPDLVASVHGGKQGTGFWRRKSA